MKQIMQAQLYQLKRNKFSYVLFAVLIFMQSTALLGEMGFSVIPAGSYVAESGGYVMSVALIFGLMLTGLVCAEDFMDKTLHCELMSGHRRRELYFGRALMSIVIGTAGTMILNIIPIAAACAIGGWGDVMRFEDVLLRYLLSLFPILRLICEFVFISYIVKNAYIVMVLAYIVSMAGEAWLSLFTQGSKEFLGIGNLHKLFDFTSWSTYTLVGEQEIVIYNAALPAKDVVQTVLASVLIGGLFLMLGYLYFEKDDLN